MSLLSLGFSPEGREVYDLDLTSAYTTGLAMIRQPNWATARDTTDIAELATVDGAMTFANIEFRFPPETRIPSLPVRASNSRGLVYPLEGGSWCTGPEMVVALAQGVTIDVKAGLHIDWAETHHGCSKRSRAKSTPFGGPRRSAATSYWTRRPKRSASCSSAIEP